MLISGCQRPKMAIMVAKTHSARRRRPDRGVRCAHSDARTGQALNAFRPAIIAPYASMAALLATEQHAGRLYIDPALVVLSAEDLPPGEYDRIATAFNAMVRLGYAANECPFLSYSCQQDWLHVNTDWAILEPVDANHHPTRLGQRSHTVLLTKPGQPRPADPALRPRRGRPTRPDPCPCGDPLPAIQVQVDGGRQRSYGPLEPAHRTGR